MKKFILLIIGVIAFNNLAFSQQKKLFKKDSTLFKSYQLDSTAFGKNNQIVKGLSFIDSDGKSKFSTDTTKSKNHNMPIFIPKGNYKIRLNEIDTTTHYSLRIIKPE